MPDTLIGVRAKIERAKKHIADLNAAVRVYLDGRPYTVATKNQPKTGHLVHYIASVQPVPTEISLLFGDAVHNLRSALDHLAIQLVRAGGGTVNPRTISFPIFNSATGFKASGPGKVKGAGQDAIKVISAIRPYKRGKGHWLWVLRELDDIDKHRVLVSVVCEVVAVTLPFHAVYGGADRGATVPDEAFPVLGKRRPLKVGHELLIDKTQREVNENVNAVLDVALGEPGVVEGEPLIKTAHHVVQVVGDVVNLLSRFL